MDAGAIVETGTGTITLAADVNADGTGNDGVGVLLIGAGATVTSTNATASAITLRGANINIDTSADPAVVGASLAGGVVIRSSLPNLPMSFGDANDNTVAGIYLTGAELAQIQTTATGTVTIGDSSQTGNIAFTIATPATTPGASTVVVQDPTGPGQIILDDGAGAGTALDGNGGPVSLTAGAGGIQTTLYATGLPLSAAGFTINQAKLNLALGFAPGPAAELKVVNNTLTNPINGSFSNLEQGGTCATNYQGNWYTFQVDYQGGDGNDLVLTPVHNRFTGNTSMASATYLGVVPGVHSDGLALMRVRKPGTESKSCGWPTSLLDWDSTLPTEF